MSEHVCVDCKALAAKTPADTGLEIAPKTPRPAPHGGPLSRRCTTHYRAHRKAQKATARTKYVARTFNLTQEEFDELWAFQGERCVCGRKPTRQPDIDHDHSCCSGRVSCGLCIRGLLCRACNRDVVGRYTGVQLRALAEYLDNPPARQLRVLKEAS